jgi:hypothetical protein
LEVFLKIMTEIDSEELVSALERIVEHYSELVNAYQRLIQVSVEEDDGESTLAAVGCVTAIRRILDSV